MVSNVIIISHLPSDKALTLAHGIHGFSLSSRENRELFHHYELKSRSLVPFFPRHNEKNYIKIMLKTLQNKQLNEYSSCSLSSSKHHLANVLCTAADGSKYEVKKMRKYQTLMGSLHHNEVICSPTFNPRDESSLWHFPHTSKADYVGFLPIHARPAGRRAGSIS